MYKFWKEANQSSASAFAALLLNIFAKHFTLKMHK
jgi:hypothetical protein